ncbi:MAG TPA: hypothetical protein VEA60_11485 [Allosphingosinicella sp.]|nr:hypothetical protein [Allosphingosinicella sp.]
MNAPNPGSTARILGHPIHGDPCLAGAAVRLPADGLSAEAVNLVLRTDEPAMPDAPEG